MPWKERYTISDEKSLVDDEIRWPQDARCCVGITVDLSVAAGPEGIRAADLKTPEAEFGANQGLSAVLALLRRHDLRATFAVPAVIAHIYADQIRGLADDGHEVAAHGFKHEDVSALERDDEAERIARATELLGEITGGRPAGWFSLPRQGDPFAGGTISPNTMDLLIEARLCLYGERSGRRHTPLLGHRLCEPARPPHPALLLSFRRPVFLDVSPQGHRPRASRRPV